MSENYVVFIEQPIKLDLLKFMLYKIQGKSFHRVMSWQPNYGTVFHLVNRHTGEVGRVRLLSSLTGNILYVSTQTLIKANLQLIASFPDLFLRARSSRNAFSSNIKAFSFPAHYPACPLSISLLS